MSINGWERIELNHLHEKVNNLVQRVTDLEQASAIEARRAETQGGSVEDESAAPKEDATTVSRNRASEGIG